MMFTLFLMSIVCITSMGAVSQRTVMTMGAVSQRAVMTKSAAPRLKRPKSLLTNSSEVARLTSQWDYARKLVHGLEMWTDGKPLLTQEVAFQPDDVTPSLDDVNEFLSRRLLDTPFDTDKWSPYLTTSQQVV
jgi:hypothetical protein